MSFLGSETFSTPNCIASCANPAYSLVSPLALLPHPLPEHSHRFTFLPLRAASEIITADAMQGGRGSGREGFLSSPDPAASPVLPQLLPAFTALFSSTAQGPLDPKHLSQLPSVSYPHPSITSCTHLPLVLDHCEVIAGLAGYIGQTE